MRVDVNDFYSESDWNRLKSFADKQGTPFLVVLTDIIKRKYEELRTYLPTATIYYAVKANPANEVLQLLGNLGACFDVASVYELRKVLALGISPDRISYGNTIKKSSSIAEFYEAGVRIFVTDSEMDLRNIAQAAPGSKIFVRILTEGLQTADWPLSRKFGCQTEMAYDLLVLSRKLGLEPYGISFHVGSQQRDIAAWDAAIAKVKNIFEWVKEEGIELQCINMGGGFPGNYLERTNETSLYTQEIMRYMGDYFGENPPQIIIEPGRSLVADAGVLVSEIVLISRKSRTALERWIYTDVGKFNGLMETLNEAIRYPIYTEKKGVCENTIIAGPTCDSIDTIYEDVLYPLPLNLSAGDRLYWISAGAYTSSYSAVEFNGFPPLKTYFL